LLRWKPVKTASGDVLHYGNGTDCNVNHWQQVISKTSGMAGTDHSFCHVAGVG
jgi:hypothetical protein